MTRSVLGNHDLGFFTNDDVTGSIEGGSIVSFLEVSNHPDLDHGREKGALWTDEHAEVSRLDVEVHFHFGVELLLAHETILVALLFDGHLDDVVVVVVVVVVVDSSKMELRMKD